MYVFHFDVVFKAAFVIAKRLFVCIKTLKIGQQCCIYRYFIWSLMSLSCLHRRLRLFVRLLLLYI